MAIIRVPFCVEAASATWAVRKAAVKEARAADTFTVIPPEKGDAIKPQNIYKELQKSETGRFVYSFIIENHIPIEVNYTKEYERGVRGYTLGNSVFINARKTKTIKLTAKTIIHEITHIQLNTSRKSQWEEAFCFAQEAKHDKDTLTYSDLRDIIKTVKELYPEYPWRR